MNEPSPLKAPAERALAGLAVFSSREEPDHLCDTVLAAMRAAPGAVDLVDVLINGNPVLAGQMAERVPGLAAGAGFPRLRVWRFALGDKSHTWNEYIERIAPPQRDAIFIDGYVAVGPEALRRVLAGLHARSSALAATGVPTVGMGARSDSRQMRQHGGIHGNLYALSAPALAQLRHLRFRLPLGLYRTDPTLAAALNFGLDLGPRKWEPLERVAVCPDANWRIRALRWWSLDDLKTHFRRVRRQAQGDLENAAVRHRFYARQEKFGALPRTAAELVRSWAAEVPAEFETMLARHRYAREAYERMMAPRDWRAADQPPELLADTRAAPQGPI